MCAADNKTFSRRISSPLRSSFRGPVAPVCHRFFSRILTNVFEFKVDILNTDVWLWKVFPASHLVYFSCFQLLHTIFGSIVFAFCTIDNEPKFTFERVYLHYERTQEMEDYRCSQKLGRADSYFLVCQESAFFGICPLEFGNRALS